MGKRIYFPMRNILFLVIFAFLILSYEKAGAYEQQVWMVGMGDSIGEGVQSADANLLTQPYSYINLLAQQIGVDLPFPIIISSPLGIIGDTSFRFRLFPSIPSLNLAVSGAGVASMLRDQADALSPEEIDSETDLVLFPSQGSQVEIVESLKPDLVICWIGNNDVLSVAISFNRLDASQMTTVKDFEENFFEITDRLAQASRKVVFANIPDVTHISFLLDRNDLIRFLGSDYGLPEGYYTSIIAMFLIKLGLDDGSLLDDPDFVLDTDEVRLIKERIKDFNEIIKMAADSVNMPVVDINRLFDEISQNSPVIFGTPLSSRYLRGLFSLDGVHPSNIAHALISNAFIMEINNSFEVSIPFIDDQGLLQIFLTDPFIDKDGDGRVAGRFGVGLLETIAPFLGISGDLDDYMPNIILNTIDIKLVKRLLQQSFEYEAQDEGYKWNKNDYIEAFKRIMGLGNLDTSWN